MAGCLSVPVSAEPLPTVELISVMDAVKPAIPEETGYAVVNLNIRKSPDKNSGIAGKYKKGEKVNILSDDGTWARTDMGYVWGGYLAKEYKCDLSIRSDSEEASRYVGYVYDMSDYSSPQAARVLMVAFWLSPYTAGALEESSLPEHRHFAPKTIRGTAVLADAFHVSFNMRKA